MKIGIILVFLLVGITACSNRDQSYYESNLEAAKEKIGECRKLATLAFVSGDYKKVADVKKDKECIAANDAIDSVIKAKRQLAKKKSKEEYDAKRKKDDAAYVKFKLEFNKMELKELHDNIEVDCHYKTSRPRRCSAANHILDEKIKLAAPGLADKHDGEELKTQRNKSCEKQSPDRSNCKLLTKSYEIKYRAQVQTYLENKDQFKAAYNKCVAEYMKLKRSEGWRAAAKHIEEFECHTVEYVAKNKKIFGFNKPIE